MATSAFHALDHTIIAARFMWCACRALLWHFCRRQTRMTLGQPFFPTLTVHASSRLEFATLAVYVCCCAFTCIISQYPFLCQSPCWVRPWPVYIIEKERAGALHLQRHACPHVNLLLQCRDSQALSQAVRDLLAQSVQVRLHTHPTMPSACESPFVHTFPNN
jgi:hypothetical protein